MTEPHWKNKFPTFVVGSLPRPEWVRELIEQRKRSDIPEIDADKLLDDAIPSAIRLQERAGVDFVSDGEWRRESYVKVFTDAVDGFELDLIDGGGSQFTRLSYPAIVSAMRPRRPIAADESSFLRSQAQGDIIVALPSPYTIARRMWSPEHSPKAYGTRQGVHGGHYSHCAG